MRPRSCPDASELRVLEHEPLSESYRDEAVTHSSPTSFGKRTQKWRKHLSGWRGGIAASIALVVLVLLINITIVFLALNSLGGSAGATSAYVGDCTTAARWTTVTHLLINLLSSLLLGASNYCMQRLVAPTRQEIDRAHAQKRWLDIGVPSVRNLLMISKARVALWMLLVVSSVPLHFLYNSVIFETIAANDVDFLIVSPEFFTVKDSWKGSYNSSTYDITALQDAVLDNKYMDSKAFENITGADCLQRYGAPFVTSSGTAFAVPLPSFRDLYGINASHSLAYVVSGSGALKTQPYSENSPEYEYCLTQVVTPECEVQIEVKILWVVVASNALKIVVMFIVLWRLNQETIVTVGDAIKSFLQVPDPTTNDCCLMSRRNVEKIWKNPVLRSNQRFMPKHREPWWVACSARRWITSLFLYCVIIVIAGWLLSLAGTNMAAWARNGFGRVDPDFLVDVALPGGEGSVIPYVLLANLPQAVISFVYLTYNGLFTCMLANREWSGYAVKRASLRVTLPTGAQRSTYFLQLPYTFSVPLLLASVLLHWFISQSIFLARVAVYKDGVQVGMGDRLSEYSHVSRFRNNVFTGVGYSNSALVASLVWGSVLVAACLFVAFVCTYPRGLPIGGTNSAVISAACHVRLAEESREEAEEDIAEKPLKWGVTIPGGRDRIGHCCFTSREVGEARQGHLYA